MISPSGPVGTGEQPNCDQARQCRRSSPNRRYDLEPCEDPVPRGRASRRMARATIRSTPGALGWERRSCRRAPCGGSRCRMPSSPWSVRTTAEVSDDQESPMTARRMLPPTYLLLGSVTMVAEGSRVESFAALGGAVTKQIEKPVVDTEVLGRFTCVNCAYKHGAWRRTAGAWWRRAESSTPSIPADQEVKQCNRYEQMRRRRPSWLTSRNM